LVAEGAYNLALVIYRQKGDVIKAEMGDMIKAEELARESLRIRILLYDSIHCKVTNSCELLAGTLVAQGKLGDETRGLYERCLAVSTKYFGSDGSSTAIANRNLGDFYYQLAGKENTVDSMQTQLLLVKPYYVEALRIYSKIDGPTHPNSVDASSRLSDVLSFFSLF
jgi:hypothetical protein